MSRVARELRLFFVAMQFLTRVPTPRWVGFEPDWLNRSARYFSLVGSVVGLVAVAVLWAASQVFPPVVAVLLSMTATLLLTGGFHEDGLADTWDALGGAVDRERALAIMKDSRIGSYGALALLVVLGLKAAALTALADSGLMLAIPALLLAHTASRAAAVTLIRVLPYAGDPAHAKAKPLARSVSCVEVAVAIGWAVLLAALLAAQNLAQSAHVFVAYLLAGAGTGWSIRWLRARLGGYTGDTLGATQQLTELAMLLGWLAVARWPA
jgi:adenosylcobinamide-GDP ribazoletransferase